MNARVPSEPEITALMIAPNRDLAQQFLATLPQTRAFQILADLKSYPPHQTLEIRTVWNRNVWCGEAYYGSL